MADNLGSVHIIKENEFSDFEEDYEGEIIDMIKFDNHYLIKIKDENISLNNELDTDITQNISIPIASAVTAYARIEMSKYKNNSLLPNLYYTDTDSLYFDNPISYKYIDSKKLGKLKIEGEYYRAIFLSSKLYALDNNEETIIKIRSLSKESIKENNINLEIIELLLEKDYKLKYKQNKWFRNLSEANIQILEQSFSIQINSLKRELIYSNTGKLLSTKAIKL